MNVTMADTKLRIKEMTDAEELINSVRVIRDAFKTVATQFGLTQQNCPTHPSFIITSQLNHLKSRGLTFFGLFLGDAQIGFIAVEKANATLYYIEKLAVLPAYRHSGYGRRLMEFALDYIRANNGQKVSIGTIDEHTVLKNWYKGLGFKEITRKKFTHLPFTVCFMEADLSPLKGDSCLDRKA